MNSEHSFSEVKGIYKNGSPNSLADPILVDGVARLIDSNLNTMVFPFGHFGTKTLKDENGNVDTQFVYRNRSDVTFGTTGQATIYLSGAHAGGIERFNDDGTPLSTVDERNVIIVATQSAETGNHTGTISAFSGNTVTGSSATFLTDYQVGELIKIVDGANTVVGTITQITTNNDLRVADTSIQSSFVNFASKIGGGSGKEIFEAIAINGDYLYCAGHETSSVGNEEAFLTKWDKDGNLVWQRKIGGVENDRYYAITHDGSHIYCTGRDGTTPSSVNGFINKWDESGNLIWQKKIVGAGIDRFYGIIHDSTHLFLAGYETTSSGNEEGFVTKWDKDGNLVWQRKIGGSGKEYFRDITQDGIHI
jgi:predicted secreted protein